MFGWVVILRLRVGLAAAFVAVGLLCPVSVRAAEPGVSSLSAVIYEPQSGLILYEKEGNTPRPMASTTKLMTALLAAERLDPDQRIQVPVGAVPVEGTQIGLSAGDSITVHDLLAGLLLASGNDAANALALLMADSLPAFAEQMNRRAAELGMENSRFVTPSGLDGDGHGASAADMARLGAAVLRQPLLAELCRAKTATIERNGKRITLSNHNKLLKLMDGCIGLKTGFTRKSGRCLVSAAERDGVTLVVVTLNGGDYWNDHIALYHYGFSLIERQSLPPAIPDFSPVAGGVSSRVSVTAELPDGFTVRKGEHLLVQVEMPRFVWASVTAGDILGTVSVYADDRLLCIVPLTAAQTVAARPIPPQWQLWWGRCQQLLSTLLT